MQTPHWIFVSLGGLVQKTVGDHLWTKKSFHVTFFTFGADEMFLLVFFIPLSIHCL